MPSVITLKAPAKINLGLLVKEKRPDGYHNIETILIPISLFDEVSLERASQGIELITLDKNIPRKKKNIVYKAADLFFKGSKIRGGVRVRLKKRIPVGAGLGGGSSDAAALLLGLNKIYGSPFTTAQLLELAVQIGMDVPFFIYGGYCYALGRGEVLEKIKGPALYVFLHTPGYSIPTRWAYKTLGRWALTRESDSIKILKEKLETGDWADWQRYVENSFEKLVFAEHPDLKMVKGFFLRQNVVATSLSGTGSTIYALVREEAKEGLVQALKAEGIEFIVAKTLNGWGVV